MSLTSCITERAGVEGATMETNKHGSSVPASLRSVRITGGFWEPRIRVIGEHVIPHQWEVLNDRVTGAEKSHAVENFRIAAGFSQGAFHGMPFQDSDVAKWIEAASYSLYTVSSHETERSIDEAVGLIDASQGADGYLNTYFTLAKPGQRWTDFSHGHELYCAGHLIEAAVAFYEATGKRTLLDVMERYVDYIDSVIGPQSEKLHAYSGHPEIELALARLYRVTGREKYLDLLRYFIDERGRQPWFLAKEPTFGHTAKDRWLDLSYHQAHAPIREQAKPEGHAVRAMYLYAGVADLVIETGDESLMLALERIWRNLVATRMYVTGGVGSQSHGERFSIDFDLPNDRAYAESCASIGLVFWAHRMLQITPRGSYGDVLERALYNGVLVGISRSGTEYFYANPLSVDPAAVRSREDLKHVSPVRQKWFGIACCPTNIARLICSLGRYVYSSNDNELFVHLYVDSEAEFALGSRTVSIRQETAYPWAESVVITVTPSETTEMTLAVRVPGWCRNPNLTVNGGPSLDLKKIACDGYVYISRTWHPGDRLVIEFSLLVERIAADPRVKGNAGRIALQRGPIVYCLEEVDNGSNLDDIAIPRDAALAATYQPDLLGGVVTVSGPAVRGGPRPPTGELYGSSSIHTSATQFTSVPYSVWSNRKPGEMMVWIREC